MQLPGTEDVNYVGDGEVLSVASEPHPGKISIALDKDEQLIAEEHYVKIPSTYTVDKLGKAGKKELVITFDDGPDSRWTPTVLRILKQYHVPAAFFMVGLQIEKNYPL